MSQKDAKASNAIVSLATFYAAALADSMTVAENESKLRAQLMLQQRKLVGEHDDLIDMLDDLTSKILYVSDGTRINDAILEDLRRIANEYRTNRQLRSSGASGGQEGAGDGVGRVVSAPGPAREGPVQQEGVRPVDQDAEASDGRGEV